MRTSSFSLSLILCCLIACTGPKNISNINLSYLYKDSPLLTPKFHIHHLSEFNSRLFIKLKSNEFLHTKTLNEEDYNAKILIDLAVLNSYEEPDQSDSFSTTITHIGTNEDRHKLLQHLDFKVPIGAKYLLKITITDVKRNLIVIFYKNISKVNKYDSQFFHVVREGNKEPLFDKMVENNKDFHISYSNKNIKALHVRYYKNTRTLAPPPHSINKIRPLSYEADSAFVLSLQQDSFFLFSPKKEGIYHFLVNPETREGLSLFNFTQNYPKITNVSELVEPLRYITTKDEFINLMKSKDKKESVDKFWISLGKDAVRSKTLIKNYYKRIEKSNTMFAAHVEGWRTDRGLIYTVMGPPTSIYRANNSEIWVYGEDQNLLSLNYTFIKEENPFSNNDYSLIRSDAYRGAWMTAVESWRQGRAFRAE